MGLLDQFTGYPVNFICSNCKRPFLLKIPKGMPIKEFIHQGIGRCSVCGCTDIEPKNKDLLK